MGIDSVNSNAKNSANIVLYNKPTGDKKRLRENNSEFNTDLKKMKLDSNNRNLSSNSIKFTNSSDNNWVSKLFLNEKSYIEYSK